MVKQYDGQTIPNTQPSDNTKQQTPTLHSFISWVLNDHTVTKEQFNMDVLSYSKYIVHLSDTIGQVKASKLLNISQAKFSTIYNILVAHTELERPKDLVKTYFLMLDSIAVQNSDTLEAFKNYAIKHKIIKVL
jgi:hypothetical protein